MIIDDIKKAKIEALKARDQVAQGAYGDLMNKYLLFSIELRKENKEPTDADTVSLIQKALKEFAEERDMYASNDRPEQAKDIQHQIDCLSRFLPQMMSEEEIRKAILGLPDKSMKTIMTAFKTQYAGKADMSVVSKVAREYQGK
jgi:uncharacterized protein YqeY